jgi:hypothetical protein
MGVPPPSGSDERPSGRTYHRSLAPGRAALAAAGVAVLAWGWLRWKPFRVEIGGASMLPTLAPGDWAVALSPRRVRRGAVVVLEHPRRPGLEIVKRVVAGPGGPAPDGRSLADDEVWVEGDAPDGSTDSRHFGPVRLDRVRGIVRLVYWPRGRAGTV